MTIRGIALCLLVSVPLNFASLLVHGAQGTSAKNAQPLGVPLTTAIGFGDEYTNATELYDVKITVIEVVRGAKALLLVKESNGEKTLPKAGFEYLLARLKFDYVARGAPGDKPYMVRENQFTAISAHGVEYESVEMVTPKPALNGLLQAPQSLTGWVVFMVASTDSKPLMTFKEDVGNTIHRGGGLWFQLYSKPAAKMEKAPPVRRTGEP